MRIMSRLSFKLTLITLFLAWTTNAEDNPIVIKDVSSIYKQPNLSEYRECHENAEQCKKVCMGLEDSAACLKQCPICPELSESQQPVVQQLNDSHVHVPSKPLDTTNIIRLTNQIHNIIDNRRSNVTFRNHNNIEIHQNISRVGGQFGLGYNNTDPCCLVLRPKKECNTTSVLGTHCRHKRRYRICGAQCTARVMLAKKVTICDQAAPFDYFEENASSENCREEIKFIPHRRRRLSAVKTINKCAYMPYWPFITCPPSPISCAGCLELPYAYILRNGMPLQCRTCFSHYGRPGLDNPFLEDVYSAEDWWDSSKDSSAIVDNDKVDQHNGGWKLDKTKCITSVGTVSDNCDEVEGSGAGNPDGIVSRVEY